MQNTLGSSCPPAKEEYRKANAIRSFLSILGAVLLAAVFTNLAAGVIASWSPTKTAKICFPYPAAYTPPDRESASRFLLSAAFFGNDALYFDSGEENTGTQLSGVNPSHMSSEDAPSSPIGEPAAEEYKYRDLYTFDPSLIPNGYTAIVPYDLTRDAKRGEVLLANTTSLTPDIAAALDSDYPIKTDLSSHSEENPLVLIVHTHATESYSESGALYNPPEAVYRTSDTSKNMVAVGGVMADILNSYGIPTIHCTIMHDLESYTDSYNLCADTIQKYLREYPSIKYVFDVHRDAITRENGDMIRPVTMIGGETAAQVMLLVGTNEKGADHPNWMTNFTVAAKLQSRLTDSYMRFARPINIRGASFNEQFTPGSLLIEIGSAANSLEEAKTAAKYLTYSIMLMIKDNAV